MQPSHFVTPRTKQRSRLWALGLLLAFVFTACSSGDDGTEAASDDGPSVQVKQLPSEGGDPELNGAVPTGPPNVGGMALPEVSEGGVVGELPLRATENGLLVLYFGYANCPDVCPLTTSTLRDAYGELDPEDAERVTVAFSTVDPARDGAEDIAKYVRSFDPAFRALRSEDPTVTGPVHETLGVVAVEVPNEADPDLYTVDHTATVFVLDDTGSVVLQWPFGMDSEPITSDIEVLLERMDASA